MLSLYDAPVTNLLLLSDRGRDTSKKGADVKNGLCLAFTHTDVDREQNTQARLHNMHVYYRKSL